MGMEWRGCPRRLDLDDAAQAKEQTAAQDGEAPQSGAVRNPCGAVGFLATPRSDGEQKCGAPRKCTEIHAKHEIALGSRMMTVATHKPVNSRPKSNRVKLPYRGGAISLLLFLVLATPPAELLETAGAYADVRGDIRSPVATPIDVQTGLSDDPAAAIPRQLGVWNGTDDDTWPEELETSLRYDSLLVRQYTRPGFYQPVQLMVITAEHAGAFHNPSVCFRAQGNRVLPIEDTAIQVDDQEHAVGRMIADKDDQPSRLVYNLYLVEQKFAAPERTTWLRLIYYGANETTAPQVEPFMLDLMSQIAPHAFEGREGERTTFQAVSNGMGLEWALGIAGVALLPVAVDAIWKARKAK